LKPVFRISTSARAAVDDTARNRFDEFRDYLSRAWPRESDLEVLPQPRSQERACVHRLARMNDGERPIGWRQILRTLGNHGILRSPSSWLWHFRFWQSILIPVVVKSSTGNEIIKVAGGFGRALKPRIEQRALKPRLI
jgi:hypothetical protein